MARLRAWEVDGVLVVARDIREAIDAYIEYNKVYFKVEPTVANVRLHHIDKVITAGGLDPDKVVSWLVANICDFEYYVKRFKQDFGL